MPVWRIPVVWEMGAVISIEADTLDEAIDRAYYNDIPIPEDGEYQPESWNVPEDIEDIRILYNDGMEDDGEEQDEEQGGLEIASVFSAEIDYAPSEAWNPQEEREKYDPDEMFGFLFPNEEK